MKKLNIEYYFEDRLIIFYCSFLFAQKGTKKGPAIDYPRWRMVP